MIPFNFYKKWQKQSSTTKAEVTPSGSSANPDNSLADFPSTCPSCNHRAYVGLNEVLCTNRGCRHCFRKFN